MQLTSFGNTFIKINTKSPVSGDSIVLIDPFETKTIGQRQPKMDADIVIYTHQDYDKKLAQSNSFIIDRPGEYETKDIFVYGKSLGSTTAFVVTTEQMTIAHLGYCPNTQLSDDVQEMLEGSDILFIPVGGGDALDGKQAAHLAQQLEPRIIIPMHYAFAGAKTKLADEKAFLKEMGSPKAETNQKFTIKKKDLPQEETKIILLH